MTKAKISLVLLSLAGIHLQALSDRYTEVPVDAKNIHVPKGFDSNDNVEVIVTGNLPNTCYRRPFGEATITGSGINLDVKATKIEDKNTVCIQALVPYMISVPLGRLGEGSYEIALNNGIESQKSNVIEVESPSSTSIDNFSYANVNNIRNVVGTKYLAIEGQHPSSCMEIDRVELIPNKTFDTYAVLPIIKQVGNVCDEASRPFVYNIRLPRDPEGDVLMHVRKLDGTALNYLVKGPLIANKR